MKQTKKRLALRSETIKTLTGLREVTGGFTNWTVTLDLSCLSVCPSDECTLLPPCLGTGGGGPTLSGIRCPK
ncbi:MAG TPA: hypothetical protein VL463_27635 [Kofleriaceae bacterium]|nr:hypothetical protein [Kofleriaceae bacterium]